MMDVAAYLERIGYSGPATPNAEALRDIHRAHLFAVPFENLDIGWKREIRIDQQAFLRKIIEDRRGGFCYELNGAFAALLEALGGMPFCLVSNKGVPAGIEPAPP